MPTSLPTQIILGTTLISGVVWFISVMFLSRGMRRLKPPGNAAPLSVSVIIAARNEEAVIGRCLEALARQNYPAGLWELILVNDNSTDQTAAVAESFRDKLPNLRVVTAPSPQLGISPKKQAVKLGINLSCNEIIITTDADCAPPPGWISGLIKHFTADIDAVVGYTPLTLKHPQTRKGIAGELTGLLARLDALINAVAAVGLIGWNKPAVAMGANFAYRRSAWARAGGFGQNISGASGDDDLLLQRIARYGGKAAFSNSPDTFNPSTAPRSLKEFIQAKRRHLSAGRRYRWDLVVLSAMLWTFNVSLVIMLIFAILGTASWIILVAVWGLKTLLDGWTLRQGAKLLDTKGWMMAFIFAELVSPLIFTFLIPWSLLGKIKWKERKLEM